MEYSIFYPTDFDTIDPEDDNMDICVRFADGRDYTFVFATPQNLYTQMRHDGKSFLISGLPMLFVDVLTRDNVEAVIASIVNNRAMLRLYGDDILPMLEEIP